MLPALLLAVLAAAGPAPRVLTLDEALRTAAERQPQLRQARAAVEAARARADQAASGLLPQVSGNAGYQRQTANFVSRPGALPSGVPSQSSSSSFDTFNYFNAGVSASQLLWDFGQTSGRRDVATANADAQAESEGTTRLASLFAVRSAYFDARAARALVGVARESLTNQEQHLQQIQGYVEVGTRPAIDLAAVRTDRANARVQLINAENGYDVARAQLNLAMGVEAPTDYDVSDEAFPPVEGEDLGVEALLPEAVKGRPELKALEAQARAADRTLAATEAAYGPSISASTGLTEGGSALDAMAWNWSLGLTLSWPLYQGGLTKAQVREARATQASLAAQRDGLKNQVRLEVEQARLAVRAAKAALEASGEALVNAEERLKLAEGRYQSGVGNVIELGDAQVALTNAAAQRVQAEYRLASARAQLMKALGRL